MFEGVVCDCVNVYVTAEDVWSMEFYYPSTVINISVQGVFH